MAQIDPQIIRQWRGGGATYWNYVIRQPDIFIKINCIITILERDEMKTIIIIIIIIHVF